MTTNPSSVTVTSGDTVTFTAAASGSPTPTVQWEVSTNGGTTWSAVSGLLGHLLVHRTSAESGDEYEAVFTNSPGSADDRVATLTVTARVQW